MIRADLHVHSTYSRHPSEWFLQRLGAQESYTEVEEVYRLAKGQGMSFVTVTDHNTIEGALELHRLHPEDTFVSVEVTTYFPENGCKVHVLVYDLTPAQFAVIQEIRASIYELRNYLKRERLACSVAHATYSVNGRLDADLVEKLVLLFDVFEGLNGARSRLYNETWSELLSALTPERVAELQAKHGIEPWSDTPWIKGFTGGSDDHAGLFVGAACTVAESVTLAGFLDRLRAKQTRSAGRHGSHRGLAFAIYKIAYEYSKQRRGSQGADFMGLLNALLFEDGRLGLKHWLTVQKVKRGKGSRDRILTRFVEDVVAVRQAQRGRPDQQIDRFYESVAQLTDDYIAMLARSVESDLRSGDAPRVLQNALASLPAMFLTAPFYTTAYHMHHDRPLVEELRRRLQGSGPRRDRRVLWFSDTVKDLNGVAVTMRELGWAAHRAGRSMKLVTSLTPQEDPAGLPPNVINLPCVYHVTPEFYKAYTLRLPSVLRALDRIAEEEPDELVISTPGPVGLVGLAAARLLGIPCRGVYHTDFTRQAEQFIGDEGVAAAVEMYTRWFFKLMDEVLVPSREYIDMLADRGLDPRRMRLFRRGVDPAFAVCDPARQAELRRRLGLADAPVLLWAGRLGLEKNLGFLLEVYRQVARTAPDVRLVLVGDGPERERLQRELAGDSNVVFTGRVERSELPHYYGLADVFVFPSTTDTFGMVVLEAQSCGLPSVVTDVGGPQEIVRSGESGLVVPAGDLRGWVGAVTWYAQMRRDDPAAHRALREAIRGGTRNDYSWEQVLADVMGPKPDPGAGPRAARPQPEPGSVVAA